MIVKRDTHSQRKDASKRDDAHQEAELGPVIEMGEFALLSMIGASRVFKETVRRIGRIALCDASVLIEGETGSGKEMAARAIHYLGPRRDRPFIPVNCGAMPDTLVEAEFFGHGRGAFTDAREARSGLIAQANSGTLFLDEIDALSPKAQVSLLRFLQDQKYRPVGLDVELRADVRIIAATNTPVVELQSSERFRIDLLYRLNILYLCIPPLRERHGDAELLAQHFLRQYAKKYQLPNICFSPETLGWIGQHTWPGNVRELENVIHRELLMSDGAELKFGDINLPQESDLRAEACSRADLAAVDFRSAKTKAIQDFERAYLAQVLEIAHGNVSAAARIAKKERRALGKLIKKYRISIEQFY